MPNSGRRGKGPGRRKTKVRGSNTSKGDNMPQHFTIMTRATNATNPENQPDVKITRPDLRGISSEKSPQHMQRRNLNSENKNGGRAYTPARNILTNPKPHPGSKTETPQRESSRGATLPPSTRSTSLPKQPVKLLTKRFNLTTSDLEQLLRDQPDYTVVGILGLEGSGKSTLLSAFSTSSTSSLSHTTNTVFATRRGPDCQCHHQTIGIDAYVTPERLILLDTQPVLSPSVLTKMILENAPCPPSLSLATLFDYQSIQLTLFLLSVCHLVIAVCAHDDPRWPLWRLLQTAEMLRGTLTPGNLFKPTKSTSEPNVEKNVVPGVQAPGRGEDPGAAVIFAYTRVPDSSLEQKMLAGLQSALDHAFEGSILRRDKQLDTALLGGSPQSSIPLFCLPDLRGTKSVPPQMARACLDHFVRCLLAVRKREPASGRVSEIRWLETAGKIWDEISNSRRIGEFRQTLQDIYLGRGLDQGGGLDPGAHHGHRQEKASRRGGHRSRKTGEPRLRSPGKGSQRRREGTERRREGSERRREGSESQGHARRRSRGRGRDRENGKGGVEV
ncbi:hypothetical protein AAMO2058_001103500 [Amorphochlora amoebiformis]|uniref:Protein SMG9 n=1 Tax=Amorphochlora amoebiformis TaxID=1561963 RepID=A0A7S0GQ65_9EUKA